MEEELVTVRRFYTTPEAELAKIALEAEGIQAFVADGIMTSMLAVAVGWAKVQVKEEDAARATEILAAWKPPARPNELDETDPSETALMCLECGQIMREGVSTCPACGWTYSAADAET
jgi:hypothetical protein